MFKKGFTLSEVLITLTIIGVVTALTIPSIMNNKPDEKKVKFLQAYNSLTGLVNEITGDTSYYWVEGYNANGVPTCQGLNCMSAATANKNILFSAHPELEQLANNAWGNGQNKLALILASRMNLQDNPNCQGATCTFTTTNGVRWQITRNANTHQISIDVDSSNEGHNTISDVNEKHLKDVDTFKMEVNNITGNVKIADDDTLGKTFIKTPEKTSKTENEWKSAFKEANKKSSKSS